MKLKHGDMMIWTPSTDGKPREVIVMHHFERDSWVVKGAANEQMYLACEDEMRPRPVVNGTSRE